MLDDVGRRGALGPRSAGRCARGVRRVAVGSRPSRGGRRRGDGARARVPRRGERRSIRCSTHRRPGCSTLVMADLEAVPTAAGELADDERVALDALQARGAVPDTGGRMNEIRQRRVDSRRRRRAGRHGIGTAGRPARRAVPRLPRVRLLVATPDAAARRRRVPRARARSARLRPLDRAGRRRELRRPAPHRRPRRAARRRRRRRRGDRRSRLGRVGRLAHGAAASGPGACGHRRERAVHRVAGRTRPSC